MLYNNLSGYLRERYGKRLKKICVDGGFTCPNRDGRCGVGGCIYCGERGAGEHINNTLSITEQVRRGLEDGTEDDGFIVYFQNFTNTYAHVSILKQRYSAALIDSRIKVLAIGTRPDCIDEGVVRLIRSYMDRVDVWVELGLQTSSDRTAGIINRGYNTDVFTRAATLLSEYGIPFVVHMIIGLPGESYLDIDDTVEVINSVYPSGVKIHGMYVMRGTVLAEMYERGEYTPLTLDEYVTLAARAITRLRPNIVLHRITGDCPKGLLVAPEWSSDKNRVIALINEKLTEWGARQGSLTEGVFPWDTVE